MLGLMDEWVLQQCGTDDVEYQGITQADGAYYCTCTRQPLVIRAGARLEELERIPVGRVYTCICFDGKRDCFWAVARGCLTRVFRLDRRLRETGTRALQPLYGQVSGIAYSPAEDALWLVMGDAVWRMELGSEQAPVLAEKYAGRFFVDVACLAQRQILLWLEGSGQRLVLRGANGEPEVRWEVPLGCTVRRVFELGRRAEGDCVGLLATGAGAGRVLELLASSQGGAPPVREERRETCAPADTSVRMAQEPRVSPAEVASALLLGLLGMQPVHMPLHARELFRAFADHVGMPVEMPPGPRRCRVKRKEHAAPEKEQN